MAKDKIKGGLADGKSLTDIANKHKVDIDELTKEFQKGMKVEMEHTSDRKIAEEIALDHLFESPKYYTNLATVEEGVIKEDVVSTITDESPDTTTVLIKYNGRNAGIVMTTKSLAEGTLEIVGIRFKEDYKTIFIVNQAIKSLWDKFEGITAFIVAPKAEAIEFWNKLGFQRISPNYLILNKGH